MPHPRTTTFMSDLDALVKALDGLIFTGNPQILKNSARSLCKAEICARPSGMSLDCPQPDAKAKPVCRITQTASLGEWPLEWSAHARLQAHDRFVQARAILQNAAVCAAQSLRAIPCLSAGYPVGIRVYPRAARSAPRITIDFWGYEVNNNTRSSSPLPLQWTNLRKRVEMVIDHLAPFDEEPDGLWFPLGQSLERPTSPFSRLPSLCPNQALVYAGSAQAAGAIEAVQRTLSSGYSEVSVRRNHYARLGPPIASR